MMSRQAGVALVRPRAAGVPLIDGVRCEPPGVFPDEQGCLMPLSRRENAIFTKLAQACLTTSSPGVVEGWRHGEPGVGRFVVGAGAVRDVRRARHPGP
ncbi:MAG: hypothetical protein ACE5HU_10230 [Acidobacteriota bacterium]